jgi:hypothetical protein
MCIGLKAQGLAVAVMLVACTDRGPGPQPKKIDPSFIRENLVAQAPAELTRLDVDLGPGKVVYLGNLISSDAPLAPGGKIVVTHYWQVKQPPGPQWRIFTIVRGDDASTDFMNLPPTDMERGHPPSTWKAGEIIQDAQEIVLRPDWHSKQMTVLTGLVEEHKHQLGDRMATDGANTKDRAVVARTIPVDLSKAPPPPGTIYVPHTRGAITVDGIANEAAWASAAASPDFVTADGSPEPLGKASARMTWDEQNLYVFVQVIDSDVYSPYTKHDEPLWKQDCVEIFIDANGDRRGYVELQVNPNNATFDSFFRGTRAEPGDESWDSQIITAVKVRGTPDKAGDTDQGWDVEIAIPLAAVKGRDTNMAVSLPPKVGDRWKLNVVRPDYRSGGGNPSATSWNRITYSDFHALDRMLTVVFADAQGSIAPTSIPTSP